MSATPGPWELSQKDAWEWHINARSVHGMTRWDGLAVAYGIEDEGDWGAEIAEANARLIAAAPTLADALFGLLAAVGEIGLTPAQIESMAKACDEASAALIASGRVMG